MNNNTGENNKGYSNSGNRNSGYWNSGDWNSGDSNSGNWNSGNSNSGNSNSGDSNSGNRNSGYWNSGDWNSGNSNSGDSNSGYSNSGDRNSGNFNSTTPDTIRCFNKDVDRETWEQADKPQFIYNVNPNIWVDESDMTDDEKKEFSKFHDRGGYLKTIEYKEAWKIAWDEASEEDKTLLSKLPNFDADVFEEITGINVKESSAEEFTVGEIEKLLGKKIKIIKEK
jgi:hypothetical protein